MTVDVYVAVKGARHHKALDRVLQDKVDKLEKVCSALKECKIVVSTKRKAAHLKQFRVDVVCFLQNSKKTLTVKSEGSEHLSLAVAEAFSPLRRQLKKQASLRSSSHRRHLKALDEKKKAA